MNWDADFAGLVRLPLSLFAASCSKSARVEQLAKRVFRFVATILGIPAGRIGSVSLRLRRVQLALLQNPIPKGLGTLLLLFCQGVACTLRFWIFAVKPVDKTAGGRGCNEADENRDGQKLAHDVSP